MSNVEVKQRPVICALCGAPMYYQGDPRCTPELTLTIELPKWQEAVELKGVEWGVINCLSGSTTVFAHVACWNEFIGERVLKVSQLKS